MGSFRVLSLLACVACSAPSTTPDPTLASTPTPAPAPPATPVAGHSTPPGYEPPEAPVAPKPCVAAPGSLYAITPNDLAGKPAPLCGYAGKVLLIVNTASFCGYAPQFTPIQATYDKYKSQGFVVLGFPSGWTGQEYTDPNDISTFCTNEYHVTFPMFALGNVQPPEPEPVYAWLYAQPGMSDPVAWNFEKFLVGRDGTIAGRFSPTTQVDAPEVVAAIEGALAK